MKSYFDLICFYSNIIFCYEISIQLLFCAIKFLFNYLYFVLWNFYSINILCYGIDGLTDQMNVMIDLCVNLGFKEQIYDVYRFLPPSTQVRIL